MARAKSPEKRAALLAAAITVMAEHGLEASTSKIARAAGVAEGSLFVYFETKDALLNELYLDLKAGFRTAAQANFPNDAKLKERARFAWDCHLDWALASPARRRVQTLLNTSDRITAETREAGSAGFENFTDTLKEANTRGAFAAAPGFASATMLGLAEAAAAQIARHPKRKKEFREAGFEVFWRAVM